MVEEEGIVVAVVTEAVDEEDACFCWRGGLFCA